jgi:DNA mismatch repair ATPase MutS
MFTSLLYLTAKQSELAQPTPATLKDLQLLKVFKAIQQKSSQDLSEIFKHPLTNDSEIKYRQKIFQDLIQPPVLAAVEQFEREFLGHQQFKAAISYHYDGEIRNYELLIVLQQNLKSLAKLLQTLDQLACQSAGLRSWCLYLHKFFQAAPTKQLQAEIAALIQKMQELHYSLTINGTKITVSQKIDQGMPVNALLKQSFAPLLNSQSVVQNDLIKPIPQESGINNLQVLILHSLAQVYPAEFRELSRFYQKYFEFADPTIERVAQEFNFYTAVIKYQQQIKQTYQVDFCYPQPVAAKAANTVTASFDLALVTTAPSKIITNDFALRFEENFLIVSGPNQGGKTTFARMVGEDYYLFKLGMPIPGEKAVLSIKSQILTHFERQEKASLLTGLLAADIERIYQIVTASDQQTLVIFNELFSSTAVVDAEQMGTTVLQRLIKKGVKGVYVTFLTKLSSVPHTVSMQSQVSAQTTERTFKVIRDRPNSQADAISLLKRYQLTAEKIKRGGTDES